MPATGMEIAFLPPKYDGDLDDVRSLIKDVCGALEKANVHFLVASPKSGVWPVDVATDLAVAIEQIPEFVRFLQDLEGKFFELDFYEQGIQRRIEFRRVGQMYEVVCSSYGGSPLLEKSISEVAAWRGMIFEFWGKFIRAVEKVAPLAVQHPWWKEWAGDLTNPQSGPLG